MEKLSKSQVSDMAKHLDAEVAAWRSRPLDAGPYRYLWIDALVVKVREDGRTHQVSLMLATAVTAEGQREILGLDAATSATGASCAASPHAASQASSTPSATPTAASWTPSGRRCPALGGNAAGPTSQRTLLA